MNFIIQKEFKASEFFCKYLALSVFCFLTMCLFIDEYTREIVQFYGFNYKHYEVGDSFLMIGLPITIIFSLLLIAITSYINSLHYKIPYEIKKIKEEGKVYTVKYFYHSDKVEYYLNDKLHREIGAAVFNPNFEDLGLKSKYGYFLEGKLINKEDFINRVNKYNMKTKVQSF